VQQLIVAEICGRSSCLQGVSNAVTEGGDVAQIELGPRDMIKTPAGRRHWFANNGAAAATVWYVIGEPEPETVRFEKG